MVSLDERFTFSRFGQFDFCLSTTQQASTLKRFVVLDKLLFIMYCTILEDPKYPKIDRCIMGVEQVMIFTSSAIFTILLTTTLRILNTHISELPDLIVPAILIVPLIAFLYTKRYFEKESYNLEVKSKFNNIYDDESKYALKAFGWIIIIAAPLSVVAAIYISINFIDLPIADDVDLEIDLIRRFLD